MTRLKLFYNKVHPEATYASGMMIVAAHDVAEAIRIADNYEDMDDNWDIRIPTENTCEERGYLKSNHLYLPNDTWKEIEGAYCAGEPRVIDGTHYFE